MPAAPAVPKLSKEQRAAVADIRRRVKKGQQVVTLGGYAGVGKTTTVVKLLELYPEFVVCAFTGKAADVLRRKGLPGATIHSTIYRTDFRGGELSFYLKSQAEVGCQGFIVDEASMVSTTLFRDLESFGLPIIAVGDHGQLPPVGEDAGLMLNPDVRLETIHRNAGPIARFAEHLRKGGDAKDWPSGGGVSVGRAADVTYGHLRTADQIICAFNRTRVGVNRTVRKVLGRPAKDLPVPGDRVICLRNDKEVGIFNGQQGVATRVDKAEREITFQPEFGEAVEVGYHPDAWNAEKTPQMDGWPTPGVNVPFDFAYCVTAHKFQGSEDDKILVFEERCRHWEHARWAYTAASRAKTRLMWAANG